jgi:hypothetical protein
MKLLQGENLTDKWYEPLVSNKFGVPVHTVVKNLANS